MSEIREKVDAELKTVKSICETIENAIKTQVDKGLDKVNTHELYEAVDIYKDLSEVKKNVIESCYKMQIMDAMESYDEGEEDEERRYYNRYRYANGRYAPKGKGSRRGYHMTPEIYRSYPDDWERDMDLSDGRMYYTETPHEWSRDYREGKSGMSRKSYMETKTMSKDKGETMKELEKYLSELSTDVTEMLKDASPEEKTMVRNKMQVLLQKV